MTVAFPNSGPITLRAHLAEYPVSHALRAGEVRSDLVAKIFESVRVFAWGDDVTRKNAVASRVESDHSFPV